MAIVAILAVVSSVNSNIAGLAHIAAGMAKIGLLPEFFIKRNKKGVPYISILIIGGVMLIINATGSVSYTHLNYVIEYKEGNCDSISCIYIDVNGLHEYNNTYGHQAGDKMLKTVAAELKECFAEHSHYRIGGDEFVIICENTAFKSILMQLNHFREQMKIHNIYIASGMEWRDENMNLAAVSYTHLQVQ